MLKHFPKLLHVSLHALKAGHVAELMMMNTIYVFYKNEFPIKFSLTDNYQELFFISFNQTLSRNFLA
jgi:hypothetical protein